MSKSLKNLIRLLSFFIIFSWIGCAGMQAKNTGRITPDKKAAVSFETYEIKNDYHYYISGSDVYPNALLGLKKTYALEAVSASLWKKIEPTPADYEALISRMQDRARLLGLFQYGSTVFDHRGNPIGIWYSILSAVTAVKMQDDHSVMIYTPDRDTYQKYEEGGQFRR
ncbi:MAG: hypothetical protein JW943_10680 [Deltaproteobacteria bacterium]|nr:hypothetical protein [Deltaproteobacteria bacterium]